ncbi:IQ domain-containing protein E isoform X2 [Esox lucius]|uniref:IQ domain-containing protein E isoform X2 n=1 Tax=Esox lucius TaxID=8010 RepID=UPI0014773B7C|nr:IQ domain-containing protein E isoform X2 [Esox lucius]
MSLVAGDVPTDEDFEDLVEDGLSLATYVSDSGKRSRKKKPSAKPSPRSPYLSSMNVNPRRAAVTAWRTLGDTDETLGARRDTAMERVETARTTRENWLASLSNGHKYLKQALALKKPKQLRSTSIDSREKEDMYDEIIHLKKSLQAQKSENDKMKAKLRRLEEDKSKKDKQIEQLLDPTKAPEYTLSLVDKKNQGSVIINGLKQRILKLEQQCAEKENTLSKLQSELKTTNLEELKITVETYFEEIQRLRAILDTAEKTNRAEIKGSQRQQKVLSSTVLRLSENLKQLKQENCMLKEELNTESPASGPKGYKDWSKQRLLRRLVELDRRLEEVMRAPVRRPGVDRGVQATPTDVATPPRVSTADGEVVAVTAQPQGEEVVGVKGRVSQLEQEKEELQGMLTNRVEEVKRLMAEREMAEEEVKRWKNEQERRSQQQRLEIEALTEKIQSLEVEDGRRERELEEVQEGKDESETAALSIQKESLELREQDIVLVQSSIRGHLQRQKELAHLRDTHSQGGQSESGGDVKSCAEADGGLVAVTLIQSVFRGHLTRSALMPERSVCSTPPPSVPIPSSRRASLTHTHITPASLCSDEDVEEDVTMLSEEDTWSVSNTPTNRRRLTPAQVELHPPPDSEAAEVVDSEDSDDDIIVSPSRPMRRREEIYF